MKNKHPFLWTLCVIVVIALGVFIYEVSGPKPIDFAGGKGVALSAYHGGDPTGVPVELDRKSTRLNSSHITPSRMPSSA